MPDYMFKLPGLREDVEHRKDVACILCLMTMEFGYRRLEQQRMDDDGAPVRERVRLSDYKGWNPRFVCWLVAHGYHPDTFELRTDGDVTRVPDPDPEGGTIPCTIAFMFWVQASWRAWAAELGFKNRGGDEAHRNALGAGRTHEEFDAWLAKKVGVDP